MSYPFPPDLQSMLQEQMAAGKYQSEDDLLRDALKALAIEREMLVAEEIDPLVVEGVKRGLADMDAGRGQLLEDVERTLRKKWNAPRNG